MICAVRCGVDGPEPLAPCLDVFAGTVRHLTHRPHRFADRTGDLVVIETEHLAKDEDRPLVGGEGFEQDEHRHRNGFGENDIGGRIAWSASSRGSGSHGPM